MTDIVSIALAHAPRRPGDARAAEWLVRFVHGDAHLGVVSHVEANVYRINKSDGTVLFFDADKVVSLMPRA